MDRQEFLTNSRVKKQIDACSGHEMDDAGNGWVPAICYTCALAAPLTTHRPLEDDDKQGEPHDEG
jgi:hypothetical protein